MLRSITPRVSLAPFGENPGDAWENHSSSSSPSVALVLPRGPRSTSVTMATNARCASRLPPLTVFVVHRFRPVTTSRPVYTWSSQELPRCRMYPAIAVLSLIRCQAPVPG